jgi:hypothetical protein
VLERGGSEVVVKVAEREDPSQFEVRVGEFEGNVGFERDGASEEEDGDRRVVGVVLWMQESKFSRSR